MELLTAQEIDAALSHSDWKLDGNAITRDLRFEHFAAAIGFVNRVAQAAESQGHHPDIFVHDWNQVRLALCTHSEGGLTPADFQLAARIDGLV